MTGRRVTERQRRRRSSPAILFDPHDLIEAIPVPIYIKDVNSVYLGCNRAFAKYLGTTRQKVIGKRLDQVHPKADAAYYRAKDLRLLARGGTQMYELSYTTKQGVKREMVYHKALLRHGDGRPKAIVGTAFDVTEKNELERKQHELLCRILPVPVVRELEETGKSRALLKRRTSIAFLDFVSFSRYAKQHTPVSVVGALEDLFGAFDVIVRKHGLEKLKTIGDSYMFAGGLFSSSYQMAQTASASLEILALLKRRRATLVRSTGYRWDARIGLHAGEVITGIIGEWRFVFDVWGDTVNVASRLEKASEPNRINVSAKVFRLLRDHVGYRFSARGKMPVKNLDPMEMYFLDP
jgi:PAS domain S-box-containing protein